MRDKIFLLIAVSFIPLSILFSQDFNEIQILSSSDAGMMDELGTSVAISGNYAVVGAWREDHDVMGNDSLVNAGAAYIFERNSLGNWVEVQKIVASDRAVRDRFGVSVAIDGNYLVVGAFRKDITSPDPDAGAAYVFERDNLGVWSEVIKLEASDKAEFDEFGTSVSIFRNYIVIGVPMEDQDAAGGTTKPEAGSAYIFKRDALGVWSEDQKLVASDRDNGDLFGIDVSIHDSTIVVGAYKEDIDGVSTDAGAAYFFQQNIDGTWSESQKVVASDRATLDLFGNSVAIFQDKAIIGAFQEDEDITNSNTLAESGAAYIFEKDGTGTWNEITKIVASDREAGDFFGNDVTIYGNHILVGAYWEDEDVAGGSYKERSGSGYIFERAPNGTWTELQKIVASNRINFDDFSTSVALNIDHAFVGSPSSDLDPFADDNVGKGYIFYGETLDDIVISIDSIPDRTFKADSSIITWGLTNLYAPDTAVFQSGESITFTPGFWAHEGSDLLAKIEVLPVPISQMPSSETPYIFSKKESTPIDHDLTIFPNPSSGTMTLQFNIANDEPFQVDLFHSSGQLIKRICSGNKKGNYSFDLVETELQTGIYFFQLMSLTKKETQKLVIVKR